MRIQKMMATAIVLAASGSWALAADPDEKRPAAEGAIERAADRVFERIDGDQNGILEGAEIQKARKRIDFAVRQLVEEHVVGGATEVPHAQPPANWQKSATLSPADFRAVFAGAAANADAFVRSRRMQRHHPPVQLMAQNLPRTAPSPINDRWRGPGDDLRQDRQNDQARQQEHAAHWQAMQAMRHQQMYEMAQQQNHYASQLPAGGGTAWNPNVPQDVSQLQVGGGHHVGHQGNFNPGGGPSGGGAGGGHGGGHNDGGHGGGGHDHPHHGK